MKSHIPPLYSGTNGTSKKTKSISFQGGSCLDIFLTILFYVLISVPVHIIFDDVSSKIINDFINPNSSTIYFIHLFIEN